MGFKTRALLVAGAVVLVATLYFMPKKDTEKKEEVASVVNAEDKISSQFQIEKFIENTKKDYRSSQLTEINRMEAIVGNGSQPGIALLDSLAKGWEALKQPGIAAYYFEKKASVDRTERSAIDAAYRYFDAFKSATDTVIKAAWVEKAIGAYKKVLEINPGNADAKTDLGICYTEGTSDPMKGIMLLREVVTENPKHENAQLNLGFLSVKSGQFDKAMERFDKVLEINPKRVDVYLYKGETALQMGKKELAMDYFNTFIKVSPDEMMKVQVQEYLKELKKSN